MKENRKMIEDFFGELHFEKTEKQENSLAKLGGKSFCVTGSFQNFSRDEIHEMIEKNGGEVRSSVSAKLDFLIAGEKAGSKMKKAEDLGVKILKIEEFLEFITEK